jgi:hypothetical protein
MKVKHMVRLSGVIDHAACIPMVYCIKKLRTDCLFLKKKKKKL